VYLHVAFLDVSHTESGRLPEVPVSQTPRLHDSKRCLSAKIFVAAEVLACFAAPPLMTNRPRT
jgi:hypothetical protein